MDFVKFTGLLLYQKRDLNTGVFLRATASGVISNNRFPFNNFVFIICLQKQNISYIFLLAIISYRKDKSLFQVWYLLSPVFFFLLLLKNIIFPY